MGKRWRLYDPGDHEGRRYGDLRGGGLLLVAAVNDDGDFMAINEPTTVDSVYAL